MRATTSAGRAHRHLVSRIPRRASSPSRASRSKIVTLSGSVEVAPGAGPGRRHRGTDRHRQHAAAARPAAPIDVILRVRGGAGRQQGGAGPTRRKRRTSTACCVRLRSAQAARAHKYVMMNAPRAALPAIQALTPGLKSPTIVPLCDPDWVAVHTVIKKMSSGTSSSSYGRRAPRRSWSRRSRSCCCRRVSTGARAGRPRANLEGADG